MGTLWMLIWLRNWELAVFLYNRQSSPCTLNGHAIGRVTHKTIPVRMQISGTHEEALHFLLMPFCQVPVVLGLPWLQRLNPRIDWVTGTILTWNSCHRLVGWKILQSLYIGGNHRFGPHRSSLSVLWTTGGVQQCQGHIITSTPPLQLCHWPSVRDGNSEGAVSRGQRERPWTSIYRRP